MVSALDGPDDAGAFDVRFFLAMRVIVIVESKDNKCYLGKAWKCGEPVRRLSDTSVAGGLWIGACASSRFMPP